MIIILKEYMKINALTSYAIISIKSIIIALCLGVMSYIQGSDGNIHEANNSLLIAFSIFSIMLSCNSINDESFIEVNTVKFKDEQFYKKIIASNISGILTFILYILVLIIVNIYIIDYRQGLNLLLEIIPLIILSTAVGNLLFITSKKKIIRNYAILQTLKHLAIAALLGMPLYYLCHNYNSPILLVLILAVYMLSLIINEKTGFDLNNIKK